MAGYSTKIAKSAPGWFSQTKLRFFFPSIISSHINNFAHRSLLIHNMPQLITREHGESADLSWIEAIWQRPVQRIFWMYGVPRYGSRGGHHHQTCQMVLQCVVGSVEVYVQTAERDYVYRLNSSNQYLLLEALDWRLMHQFSADAVLVVFADKPFETTIYVDSPYRLVNSTSTKSG